MKGYVRACAAVLLVCGACAAISGKAFYCRDPDTGKLHVMNTTWPASTFCGNYTCKMRKKNIATASQYAAIREINVTKSKARLEPKKTENNYRYENKIYTKLKNMSELDQFLDVHDRYLNEEEIKTITELLHNVKKSDLEAIVEVYNLAQDIYKEMDKNPTDHNVIEEKIAAVKQNKIDEENTNRQSEPNVIMYSPESTKAANTRLDPQRMRPVPNNYATYFDSTLNSRNFGKLPYFYPLSYFQRTASYMHYPPDSYYYTPKNDNIVPQKTPCSRKKYPDHELVHQVSPHYNAPAMIRNEAMLPLQTRPHNIESFKIVRPPVLLPYPFAYIPIRNSTLRAHNPYYKPTAYMDWQEIKHHRPFPVIPLTNGPSILVNTDLKEDLQNVGKPLKKDTLHNWSGSTSKLDDLKTTIMDKTLLLKKKVKIDKVGKVIKLDELTRTKRHDDLQSTSLENVDTTLESNDETKNITEESKYKEQREPRNRKKYRKYNNRNVTIGTITTTEIPTTADTIVLNQNIPRHKSVTRSKKKFKNLNTTTTKLPTSQMPITQITNLYEKMIEEMITEVNKNNKNMSSVKKGTITNLYDSRSEEIEKVTTEIYNIYNPSNTESEPSENDIQDKKDDAASMEIITTYTSDYEAYIERTECHSDDIEPGFFRVGNSSEPYPACCPQRIG